MVDDEERTGDCVNVGDDDEDDIDALIFPNNGATFYGVTDA